MPKAKVTQVDRLTSIRKIFMAKRLAMPSVVLLLVLYVCDPVNGDVVLKFAAPKAFRLNFPSEVVADICRSLKRFNTSGLGEVRLDITVNFDRREIQAPGIKGDLLWQETEIEDVVADVQSKWFNLLMQYLSMNQ